MLLSPLIISQLSILPSSWAAFEGNVVLWVCLCPDWGFLECRDPTFVSSTVLCSGHVYGMNDQYMPIFSQGRGLFVGKGISQAFWEETASELSLKAVSASLPRRLEFSRHLGWNLGIAVLEKFLGLSNNQCG